MLSLLAAIYLPFGIVISAFSHGAPSSGIRFIENKGQWVEGYEFKTELKGSNIYYFKNEILIDLWDNAHYSKLLDCAHKRNKGETCNDISPQYKKHAYSIQFLNANPSVKIQSGKKLDTYFNYYIGNDPGRWKSEVGLFEGITYTEIYPGINLEVYGTNSNLKYDYVVRPGSSANQIKQKYSGIDKLKIHQGNLVLYTNVGEVRELKPVAWQVMNEKKVDVQCRYKLDGNIVSFDFPQGYDKKYELIIDPTLIFSTFSGATADNWGYTATNDQQGNGYAGGIVFAQGFPVTTGAYDATFNGGNFDCTISKFNGNGTQLLFSTFLGGSSPEMPHSMVVNSQNELIVMGNTGSGNFPTTPGAYQHIFHGGPSIGFNNGPGSLNWATYSSGIDIFVTKFNANGTALLGSTFVGGTGNDGVNVAANLVKNYADEFRGEVVVDNFGNIYVVSTTLSTNFPVVNAFQPVSGGGQDAVVFKLNSALSTMMYSSYYGGSNADAGFGIQFNSQFEPYFCGGTESINITMTPGAIKPNNGGGVDGFLVRLNTAGSAILNSTYIGTISFDQTYFVQIDIFDNVYVTGQTTGLYPIVSSPSGPVYSTPGAGQFIHKLNNTLTSTIFSTTFGGAGGIKIVPSAFLVDICNYIYISGWGGTVNAGFAGGNTFGLPTTPGAFQTTTSGSDFYLVVFKEDALGIHYASFFGGGTSAEHVDGGTSRFDKDGIVYQAICAGCGSLDDLPTSAGAYSATNNSSNCNLALFKFDVSDYTAIINPAPPPEICVGVPVNFSNQSTGGTLFTWFFGDGTTANTFNAVHTYNTPGTYLVQLVAQQQAACIPTDTASVTVTILPLPDASVAPAPTICPGQSVTLNASGGDTYSWFPAPGMPATSLTIPNPTVNPTTPTNYTVVASNQCGTDTASVLVDVFNFVLTVTPNDTICLGSSTQISASGGVNYVWTPAVGLSNPNVPNPIASPIVTTVYTVVATDVNNCTLSDSVRIQVDIFPVANAGPDTTICYRDKIQLNGTGGNQYTWVPPTGLSNANISNPIAGPDQTTTYTMTAKNACGQSTDDITITVQRIYPISGPDTLVCPGEKVQLFSYGGTNYSWYPSLYVSDPNSQFPFAMPNSSTVFIVTLTDTLGCKEKDSVYVGLYPPQSIGAGIDQIINFGESAILNAIGSGSILWTPSATLSCDTCATTIAQPFEQTTYLLTITDINGCKAVDSVTIYIRGMLYVPNTFTPNANATNDMFFPKGEGIKDFEMRIFNRWGEQIFLTDKMERGWDGLYKGKPAQLGVYVYKIYYTNIFGEEGNLVGHVNLVR